MAHILIVDDQSFIRRIVTRQLEAAGHRVTSAEDGAQALELLDQISPDLIFCDIGMPNLDGFETLERLRAATQWADVPVVMLTGHGQVSDWERAQALGANGYLTKPFSTAQLVDAINQWI